ncbi:DNA primase [Haploplasma modicum]|uniref:DNA primase n=1 Tax=Haploplasma modicum TaxID=2150 RepID=UPI00214C08D2|nr:DNA primase [Haploplasma modicum]MCR1809019.1 DNA primase [Haploplasma modicum]
MIPDEILKRIDDETDLVSLVSEFISLERKGKNYFGLCPFHEDSNPSFSVSPEKNIAMCMTCHSGGRPINFYRRIKNISFNEAAIDLANRIGIEVGEYERKNTNVNDKFYALANDAVSFYQLNLNSSLSGKNVLSYLNMRNISDDSIKKFKLGYAPNDKDTLFNYLKEKNHDISDMITLGLVKQSDDGSYYDFFRNRLIFPITNTYDNVVGFSARSLDKNEKNKYVNSPETPIFKKSDTLYNLSNAKLEANRKQEIIIHEGFFDVIKSDQNGIKNAIATMGTALTATHIKLIGNLTKNVVLAFDGDNAGIESMIKLIPSLNSSLSVEVLKVPDRLDPDEYLTKYGLDKYLELFKNKVDSYQFMYEYYESKTNFDNANDIKQFQTSVASMLKGANMSVVSLYKERLAKRLNISSSDIKLPKEKTFVEKETKSREDKLESKFELSDIALFIEMTKSKELFTYINDQLTISHYSNLVAFSLRTKLISYYEYNEYFILGEFRELLDIEQNKYLEDRVFKHLDWQNNSRTKEVNYKKIDREIEVLKATELLRRKKYLAELIVERLNNNQKTDKEIIEYKDTIKKLNKIMEDKKYGI